MYQIIINPIAGKGRSLKALNKVTKLLDKKGIDYRVYITERPGHASVIAADLCKTPNSILVLGGEGTMCEVLNGITDFNAVTIGLIPCGTGNDFCKFIGIPSKVEHALDIVLAGKTKFVDFIEYNNGGRCLNCLGTGMDVDVLVQYLKPGFFKGKLRYYICLLDELFHLKFHKVRIKTDNLDCEKEVFIIALANGKYFGGGMPISPESDVCDGKLNLIIINKLPKRKIPLSLLKFLRGKHLSLPCTESYLVDKASLEILDEGFMEADGEIKEAKTLDCRVVSNTLKLFSK